MLDADISERLVQVARAAHAALALPDGAKFVIIIQHESSHLLHGTFDWPALRESIDMLEAQEAEVYVNTEAALRKASHGRSS